MGDRLIHRYFDINLDILRETVTDDLPHLLDALPTAEPQLILDQSPVARRR